MSNALDDPFKLTPVSQSVTVASPAGPTAEQDASARREREKKEIARLRSQHEDYKSNEDRWRFWLKSYEGGPDYISADTLFKHQRENQADFEDRLKRAQYQNYCQPLVDFVPEFIFEQPIEREPNKELDIPFGNFIKNVDRCGTNIDEFMRQVAEDERIFGMCWVQLDKPVIPEGIDQSKMSVKQASDLGLDVPYLVLIKPLEILDWAVNQFGIYEYVKRVEYTTEPMKRGYRKIEKYSEWDAQEAYVSIVDVTDPDEPTIVSQTPIENKWKFVPFIPAFYKRGKTNKDIGLSFLEDIAYQNRHVFNMSSLIDEFLNRQCFNLLAMERDTSLPTKDSVEGEIRSANVLDVPKGATHMPAYVSPPTQPAKFIQEERSFAIREMYRQAAQDLMSELISSNSWSGDSQKQAFARTIPVIGRTADSLENFEGRVWQMWAKMQGKDWTGKVNYKDDFSVTNLQDLLLQLTTIFNNLKVMSPTFIKEEWKRIVKEFDGKIPHETMLKILNEIDAMKDDELTGIYDGSNDIKATMGVPSTGQMMQGKMQKGSTDKKIAMRTGKTKTATKEANPDAPKRATGGKSNK